MSITQILPLIENLSHVDKFKLIRVVLTQLATEEGLLLQIQAESNMNQGERMEAILQRMANRQALSHIHDPGAWQREIREDHVLSDRE